PWTCTPGRVTAQPGTPLQLMVVGDPSANPVLLLVSATPALCVPIPGVHRSLIVRPDAVLLPLSLNWFRVYHVCASWVGSARVQLPPGAPASVFLLQVFAPVAGQPTLSNAVRLQIQERRRVAPTQGTVPLSGQPWSSARLF